MCTAPKYWSKYTNILLHLNILRRYYCFFNNSYSWSIHSIVQITLINLFISLSHSLSLSREAKDLTTLSLYHFVSTTTLSKLSIYKGLRKYFIIPFQVFCFILFKQQLSWILSTPPSKNSFAQSWYINLDPTYNGGELGEFVLTEHAAS